MSYTPTIPSTELAFVTSPLFVQARQEIEYLRRWYCRATDLFGMTGNADANAEARRIYHRIFTPDASVQVTGATAKPLAAIGPDGWAAVVMKALNDYVVTQHLAGTQIVDIRTLQTSTDASGQVQIVAGTAGMTSYLQAWHVWPDSRLRLVMGNYVDEVLFVPGTGWQIRAMNLVHLSAEVRQLGPI